MGVLARSWRLTALLWCARLLLTLPVRRARLRLSGQLILTLRAGRLVAAVRRGRRRIGAPSRTLLVHDLASDILRGVQLAHNTLIARRLLRGDREGHHAWPRPADTGSDGKAAEGLGERAEAGAGAVVDLNAPDVAIGIRIELDVDIGGTGSSRGFRHFQESRGPANTER